MQSANFGFLEVHDARLVKLGALAEHFFRQDPPTSLVKSRQFAELLTKMVAARHAMLDDDRANFDETLRRLSFERVLPKQAADILHAVRRVGNVAVHEAKGSHAEALSALKLTRQLGIWFHRTYGKAPGFDPGPFIPPPEPVDASAALREQIEALKQKLAASESGAERAARDAMEHATARETAEQQLRRETEERAVWERLAQDSEAEKNAVSARLEALQAAAEAQPQPALMRLVTTGEEAAARIDIDEADTRALIDQQLRNQGWEADTERVRHAAGARPAKGRNVAIAEWPTASGPADYALFAGLTLVGVVEAKRRRRNVSAAIDQAERYAASIAPPDGGLLAGGPWGEHRVPFVFAANGRPYLEQLRTESGIWFRDVRRAANHRRALVDWFTPDGLTGLLELDQDKATAALRDQPFDFGFPLRSYQVEAIKAVEAALADDRRSMLVAMATGTGKTKLAIALLYRLLTAKRFRRICFVVDRSALGIQAAGEFATTKVVSARTFAETFGLKGLEDVVPEAETRVHICTIQGLVRRVLYQADPADVPPIDQYDLIVVDECHRGYLLDREMSDTELSFRGQEDYISKYRRVLDYFDAVKIGLTATPALHTTEIFGEPIFKYSYRDAVIDGHLIDHEPPIRIETNLSRSGIGFSAGDQFELLDTRTGAVDLSQAPDEIHFEVDSFNKNVVTEAFNRVVAEELARHVDPALPGKMLVFAATDAHADIVVSEIKKAFEAAYGEIDDASVRKITGSVDQVQKLIRSFRNDANPKIAVTVDLLTTGIDVPSITSLVFLRRVNSRILYEQMIGRATRQCPEIGKEVFRIFDAVDLYANLQNLTDMKPVVVNPLISFEQLVREMLTVKDEVQREAIRDQLIVKLRRRLKSLSETARQRFEAVARETAEATLSRAQSASPAALRDWLAGRPGIGQVLDWSADGDAPRQIPISHHDDSIAGVTRGYGTSTRPEDFLDGFTAFVRGNVNTIAALKIVLQRPRDLTRADLRELRLALDREGYSETSLRTAFAAARNEEIAASIIGFVRQAALGDALVAYEDRVRAAMRRLLASRAWTDPQRRWLLRIGEQVAKEVVVDRTSLDDEPFRADGGFARLNKVFGGELESVLAGINEELWKHAS